jgi:hypothetical protein
VDDEATFSFVTIAHPLSPTPTATRYRQVLDHADRAAYGCGARASGMTAA